MLWHVVWVSLTVLGEVKRVTFANEETGFRVIRLSKVTGLTGQTQITAVGVMPAVGPGTRVRISGKLEDDAKHGERLRVESLVAVAPDTLAGLEQYLGSGVIRGIGPAYAKRIVKYFGLESLRILDAEPHRLAEVPGLGEGRVEELRSAWVEHTAMSNVLLALQSHGASPSLAGRIVKHFGETSAQVVQQNPYRLAIELPGVGFKTADRIARARGLALDDPERAQAGVLHELRAVSEQGHCYCERGVLLERTAEMLGVESEHVDAAIDSLGAEELLVVEGEQIYLAKLHQAESRVVARLTELASAPRQAIPDWALRLVQFEQEQDMRLADAQRAAVAAAAQEKLLVITGGPGVGKTTLVNAILSVFAQEKLRISLAAPTGRAAKRLTESTGRQAFTLHRLLEVEGRGGKFARHAENPLECDLLIVDEASMIDISLAASLLEAVPNAARVVVVGDADQLPSVGPGAFLQDLIASDSLPVARLDVIFRQAGQSGIVENSHAILRGEQPTGATDPQADFFVIQCSQPERAQEVIRELVCQRIPSRFGLDPVSDIQVLTPMHRGQAGTVALNRALQQQLNPDGKALSHGDSELRVGDKVLQLKNDYNKEVFNGDLGEVATVNQDVPSALVRFETEDGTKLVSYEKSDLAQLALAYATTIHKSQGSEYPAVVIPFLNSHFVMLSRNLLYTAVTRAKKLCVLVADKRALDLALQETRRELRQTGLCARLSRSLIRVEVNES